MNILSESKYNNISNTRKSKESTKMAIPRQKADNRQPPPRQQSARQYRQTRLLAPVHPIVSPTRKRHISEPSGATEKTPMPVPDVPSNV